MIVSYIIIMYICMTDPGYINLMASYGYGSVPLAWQARDTGAFLQHAQIGQAKIECSLLLDGKILKPLTRGSRFLVYYWS